MDMFTCGCRLPYVSRSVSVVWGPPLLTSYQRCLQLLLIQMTRALNGHCSIAVRQSWRRYDAHIIGSYLRPIAAVLLPVLAPKVSNMIAALKSGSKGTQACNEAISTIRGLIGDLETTAMFAAAGALQETSDKGFTEHRENILLNAKVTVYVGFPLRTLLDAFVMPHCRSLLKTPRISLERLA